MFFTFQKIHIHEAQNTVGFYGDFFSEDEGSRKVREGPGADPRPPRSQVARPGAHPGRLEVTLFFSTTKKEMTPL